MLPQAPDTWTVFEAAHLLSRAGFGGTPDQIKALHALGRAKAVEKLLAAEEAKDIRPAPEWASREQAVVDMRERAMRVMEARRNVDKLPADQQAEARQKLQKQEQMQDRQRSVEAQGWWFRRMLLTQAPLREKMTLFWHDHFATSVQKVKQPALVMIQNELFRQNALGNFRSLTQQVALDPAMMLYLDTQSSKKGQPNENFARELFELFTLGEGHYTEQDIRESARAFTGYQINRMRGEVFHNRRQWDDGVKTVFGKSGKFDGKDIVNLALDQPQCARMMVTKFWEYFVAEDPATPVIDSLAATFRAADYELAPVLREIFLSKEFYDAKVVRNQIKSPIQYLVQMLRQLELKEAPGGYTLAAQQQLGQVLFLPPNVAGWDWGRAWINTNTLLTRYNIAGFITKGAETAPGTTAVAANDEMMQDEEMMEEKPGEKGASKVPKKAQEPLSRAMGRAGNQWTGPDYETLVPRELRKRHEDLIDSLGFRFFQAPLPTAHRKRFLAFASEKAGVVFTNHEIAELIHLMLSTPDYQLC